MDLILASSRDADLRYAIKSEVSDPVFFLEAKGKKFLFLDHREMGVFTAERGHEDVEAVLLNPFLEIIHGKNSREAELALHLLPRYADDDRNIFVPRGFPLDLADKLRAEGYAVEVRHPFYPERAIKSATEIEAIKNAITRTGAAFARIEEILRESEISNDRILWQGETLTSEVLKAEAEIVLLREGMADVEGMIIASEAHSAIPHHKGEGPILPHQPLVCDIFPRSRDAGYFADVTRTYVKGEPSSEVKKMYNAVLAAQTHAIHAIRSGIAGGDIHAIAAKTLENAGFKTIAGEGFIHGTGHGVGLEVHETPHVGAASRNILQSGNVITVEPGLYYEKHGGIRIEDVVLVAEDGCENLTDISKIFTIN